MTNPEYAWLDGLVDWNDANCHVSSLAFKYGAAVFEGIRAYWDGTQFNIWQLDAHLARLEDGQRFMRFTNPLFSKRDAGGDQTTAGRECLSRQRAYHHHRLFVRPRTTVFV
ncbi:hypothetical protein [Sulfitobacter sp.]|uniref:hypothetical protein n=1 Tax=Sulfitobacter sp. TaxID=1903071 RepID=UPI003002A574